MKKLLFLVLILSSAIITGCSDDDSDNPVTPPPTGEVLLATVSSDSVAALSATGLASNTVIRGVTTSNLNFTDRDSARISFYYTGQNNLRSNSFYISYPGGTIYSDTTLVPSNTEQYVDVTIPSPNVDAFFSYTISVLSPGAGILAYFKFRDLKIYKK